MKHRTLGRTGLQVSVVGFGGIPIQGLSFEDAALVLHAAFDVGINFIDSARGYTDSEEKIGHALKDRRAEMVIATKSTARDALKMEEEIETSLRNLKTDVIDLYQVHAPESDADLNKVLGPGGALEALDRAKTKGKVRFVGVTGHVPQVLEKALGTGLFDTVQLPFNPIETERLNDVIPVARKANLGIIGMKPIAGGALGNVPLALRFSLVRGVDVVIPGMDSVAQVKENAQVGEALTPPDGEALLFFAAEKERLGTVFCRRCGYCMPCPTGLHIPYLLLLKAYHERYDLKAWALDRLNGFDKRYSDCVECGECVERCPYDLPVPELMQQAVKSMG